MINLLKETIDCLKGHDKSESDVLWVGCCDNNGDYKTTWEDFKSKANFEYDNGFGEAEIPSALVIVGNDFWLERDEYDGSEGWVFKLFPIEPTRTKELQNINRRNGAKCDTCLHKSVCVHYSNIKNGTYAYTRMNFNPNKDCNDYITNT